MAEIIRMPKMSDTMEEGVIAQWLMKVGDEVKSGDVLAEVETDKATMELDSYFDGILLHIGVSEQESVPIDGIIAVIGSKDEDVEAILKNENGNTAEVKKESKEEVVPKTTVKEKTDTSNINATLITMPKMSDTMEEGTIAGWMKKVGDKVASGEVIAEIETDKATMEFESYWDGILLYTGPKEGDSVPVDAVLAVIGEKGADFQALIDSHSLSEEVPVEVKEVESTPAISNTQSKSPVVESRAIEDGSRLKVSPLARKMASDLGYDISNINGSGDNGRIVKRDIESYQPSTQTASSSVTDSQSTKQAVPVQLPQVVGEESYTDENLSQMRKTIARRLSESKFTAPHFYLTMEMDMDNAIAARKSMNEVAPVKISFNDIILKAVATALRRHPNVNVSWLDDKIRKNHHINIGVAVAVPEGLIVPVVRFADNKTVSHISAEVKDLATRAMNKQLQPTDWEGSTFTISNLGMYGIEEFTAIINPPDACILAIGGIKQTPVVKNGQVVPGNTMKVTLSCDHRAVDGAVGSEFLKTLRSLLEDPIRILV